MKTKFRLLVLAAMVLWPTTAAWADFYVVGVGKVGTRITSVPYTISQPGFYFLSGNLTYSGTFHAITVNADDVTIDLMGFSLIKDGPRVGTGVYMSGRTNVEIRNGTVRGFGYGVREASATGNKHRAINVRATGNLYGIYFLGSNHLLQGCSGSNNDQIGLFLTSGVITGCTASNNSSGIVAHGPANVLGNTALNNSGVNFHLGNGTSTAILVDQNCAFGLTPSSNYYAPLGTSGIRDGVNAGG
ncbi:MAG: right-handed parallel beta-helix repeat-containing protein [Thermodesulfobacteriota bacterium]